jgi:hypothetical protein
LLALYCRNLLSREPVVDPTSAVDVSLTTYGRRTRYVFGAIESIGHGRVKPRRVYLWVDAETAANPPSALARLERRGLELRETADYGPFKKFYPYVTREWDGQVPLVTADDDVVYPHYWLAELLETHARHPEDAVAYRAHQMRLEGSGFASYASWERPTDPGASYAIFGTGVSGILYPEPAVAALAAAGDGFLQDCPHADDVWIHWVLVQSGIKERTVPGRDGEFPSLPRSQHVALWFTNRVDGRNDAYISAMYGPELVEQIRHALTDAGDDLARRKSH